MATEKREVKFWTCDDGVEELMHTEIEDAIEETLDDLLSPRMTAAEVLAALPKTITVYGYAPMVIPPDWLARDALEVALEHLDEEYGSPNSDYTEPTENMRAAALVFATAIVAEYQLSSWACEKVTTREIEVEPWVRENRPDWLED